MHARVLLVLLVGGSLAACDASTRTALPPPPAADASPDAPGREDSGRDAAGSDAARADAPVDDAAAHDGGAPSATIHYIGRFDTSDPSGPRFAWPGSAIVATFTGTGIAATLDDTGGNFFTVVVDGGAPSAFQLRTGKRTYDLATGLSKGTHTLTLTKRTESFVGVVQLLGLTPSGGALVPTPPPFARRIELIGDSITCGSGDLGTCDPKGACCGWSVPTEDETVAYGALTAAALGAQQTAIAYSGIGMFRNGDRSTNGLMGLRFLRTLADDPSSLWPFTAPPPDVVVINLGTNDFWTGDPGKGFVTTYEAFVTGELRPRYPSAYVLVALSAMISGPNRDLARTDLEEVVSALVAGGDAKVSFFEFDLESPADGYGCNKHPNAVTQQKGADKLTAAVRALTGW